MPNYNLVVNSQFKPFTYQELLAPALMATQAHEQLEDTYSDLAAKSSIWDNMTNPQTDPIAHKIYQDYDQQLRSNIDTLNKEGLTPDARQNLMNMRAQYSKDIIPIENAYNERKRQADMQAEVLNKDPTHFFAQQASTTSLDDYLKNPTLNTLNQNYSGALLTQQASQIASNLAKGLSSYGRGKSLDNFTNTFIQKYGLSSGEVMNAIYNPNSTQSAKVLNAITNEAMASSGMGYNDIYGNKVSGSGWADQQTLNRGYQYARQGLWSAIGGQHVVPVDNYGAKLAAQEGMQIRAENRDFAHKVDLMNIQQQMQNQGAMGNSRLNPTPIRNQEEITKNGAAVNDYLNKGYFRNVNGQYIMTNKGWNAYRQTTDRTGVSLGKNAVEGGQSNTTKFTQHSDFYNFMNKLNAGKPMIDQRGNVLPGYGPHIAGNLFGKFAFNNREGAYDTYHSTEYDRQVSGDYAKAYTQQLWSHSKNNTLQPVVYDPKKGWQNNGKALSTKDLKGYEMTNVAYNKFGTTAILQKEGADPIRVKVPAGINVSAESGIQSGIFGADTYGEILHRNKQPKIANGKIARDTFGNVIYTDKPLTNADKAVFIKNQNDALNSMNFYGSQMVVPSKTKDEEWENIPF